MNCTKCHICNFCGGDLFTNGRIVVKVKVVGDCAYATTLYGKTVVMNTAVFHEHFIQVYEAGGWNDLFHRKTVEAIH